MNTSKLADISEILSSLAILATLVYLTIQVQQNTEALQANQRQSHLADRGQATVLGIPLQ